MHNRYDWRTDIDLETAVEEIWIHQDSDQNTNEQPEVKK